MWADVLKLQQRKTGQVGANSGSSTVSSVQPTRLEIATTYIRLGVFNLVKVFAYRIKKKYAWYERTMPIGRAYKGPFLFDLRQAGTQEGKNRLEAQSSGHNPATQVSGSGRPEGQSYTMFSHIRVPVDGAPDWFANPLTGERVDAEDQHWSRTNDFSTKLGDIKCVWEASRFDWLPQKAWRIANPNLIPPTSRNLASLGAWNHSCGAGDGPAPWMSVDDARTIENWVADWVAKNPVNQGPNWRCGQEVSIRAINMLLAAKILSKLDDPTPAFLRFLSQHARRVLPTVDYAVGQGTNHATSEAVALFLVGHYLAARTSDCDSKREFLTWQRVGRNLLEKSVRDLFSRDGVFAQYSVNYHRMVVDTVGLAEAFRRQWELRSFSVAFYDRMRAATVWLSHMMDHTTGEASNLGPNDGAYLFNLINQPYRDFRPTILFTSALFIGNGDYGSIADQPMTSLFELPGPHTPPPVGDRSFAGGYVRLTIDSKCWGICRFASFKSRPKDGDVLHLDLWRNGQNVLRDAGSYTFGDENVHYEFTGVASHNTVQFDQREQMRRISRFLVSDWIAMDHVSEIQRRGRYVSWSASYTDYAGATHHRSIAATDAEWTVEDTVCGFKDHAVIRWRLAPENWRFEGNSLQSAVASISVESDHPFEIRLVSGRESRYYMQVNEIPVLEITTRKPGSYRTRITWR